MVDMKPDIFYFQGFLIADSYMEEGYLAIRIAVEKYATEDYLVSHELDGWSSLRTDLDTSLV